MTHNTLINQTVIQANKYSNIRLWSNPVGFAYAGTVVKEYNNNNKRYITIVNPRPIKYGLGKGTLDTIGFKVEDISGYKIPRFISFDAKIGKDKLSDSQTKFRDMVNSFGGISSEIREGDNVVDLLKKPLLLI